MTRFWNVSGSEKYPIYDNFKIMFFFSSEMSDSASQLRGMIQMHISPSRTYYAFSHKVTMISNTARSQSVLFGESKESKFMGQAKPANLEDFSPFEKTRQIVIEQLLVS